MVMAKQGPKIDKEPWPPSFEAVLSIILLERCDTSIHVKIEGLVVLVYDLILN